MGKQVSRNANGFWRVACSFTVGVTLKFCFLQAIAKSTGSGLKKKSFKCRNFAENQLSIDAQK